MISIRRCHSLQGEALSSLPAADALQALLCAGLDAPLTLSHATELRRLRVLSLVDCRLPFCGLLELLPSMRELRCLLMGGALLEEELEATAQATHSGPTVPTVAPLQAIWRPSVPGSG